MEKKSKSIYDIFVMKSAKIKDNKIICLNLLNKRLLEYTNYTAPVLWSFEQVGRMVKLIMEELEMDEFQASCELKRRISNDKTLGSKMSRPSDKELAKYILLGVI